MDANWLWPAGLSILLLIGGWLDTRYRRLPNWLALLLLAYGLAHCMATGGLPAMLSGFGHTVLVLIAGMLLFRFGVIGGGDAKFYAGAASYFLLPQGLAMLTAVSLAGLILVILWIAVRRTRGTKISKTAGDHAKFPYGVAIAAGAITLAIYPVYAGAGSI
jgi:prepilin peptidase CpaA